MALKYEHVLNLIDLFWQLGTLPNSSSLHFYFFFSVDKGLIFWWDRFAKLIVSHYPATLYNLACLCICYTEVWGNLHFPAMWQSNL
mgnify:CR=1 FL=1